MEEENKFLCQKKWRMLKRNRERKRESVAEAQVFQGTL